jgi:alpha-beta hydrolase superfamily lysophospholipase
VTLRSPFEVLIAPERTVRGVRTTPDQPRGTLLFVHELGADLDEFGQIPDVLSRHGFDTVCIDLPGHGLSDGEEPEPGSLRRDVMGVFGALAGAGRPLGLVVSGVAANLSTTIGRPDGVVAHVVVNPVVDDGILAQGTRVHATRMVLHGDGENLVGTPVQKFFQMQLGEKMLVHNPVMKRGTMGIVEEHALLVHVQTFFKRYLK